MVPSSGRPPPWEGSPAEDAAADAKAAGGKKGGKGKGKGKSTKGKAWNDTGNGGDDNLGSHGDTVKLEKLDAAIRAVQDLGDDDDAGLHALQAKRATLAASIEQAKREASNPFGRVQSLTAKLMHQETCIKTASAVVEQAEESLLSATAELKLAKEEHESAQAKHGELQRDLAEAQAKISSASPSNQQLPKAQLPVADIAATVEQSLLAFSANDQYKEILAALVAALSKLGGDVGDSDMAEADATRSAGVAPAAPAAEGGCGGGFGPARTSRPVSTSEPYAPPPAPPKASNEQPPG